MATTSLSALNHSSEVQQGYNYIFIAPRAKPYKQHGQILTWPPGLTSTSVSPSSSPGTCCVSPSWVWAVSFPGPSAAASRALPEASPAGPGPGLSPTQRPPTTHSTLMSLHNFYSKRLSLTLSLSSILSTLRVSLLASSVSLLVSLLAVPRWISAASPGSTEMIPRPRPAGLGRTLMGLVASTLRVTAARPLPALSRMSVDLNLAPTRTNHQLIHNDQNQQLTIQSANNKSTWLHTCRPTH